MATRENISVSVTPQQAEFLARCVASGRYQSVSEVLREAIRMFEDRQTERAAELARVRTMIDEGLDAIDRGEIIDADTFFSEWDDDVARIAAKRRRKAE
jgi:antitoxin ParD1/3/4